MMNAINSKKAQSIIDRFDAPFFYYDLDKLKAHLEYMAKGLDPDIKLWYACKANPMSAILKVLRNLGFGIDVASSGELHQVLNIGVNPEHILATGPGKSKAYLEQLVNSGVKTIVLESLNQVYWLNEIAQEKQQTLDCLLRVQLDWDEGKSVLGGDEITPFGISPNDWEHLDQSKTNNLNIKGFHVFQWGNILDVQKLEQIWRKTVEDIQKLSQKISVPVEVLDLGGGLGIPYTFEQKGIDFQDVHSVLKKIKQDYQLNQIWMELGRFTVGECGYYFTKIVDKKQARGRDILVCDGGINHIARVALVNQTFPAKAFKDSSAKTKIYHIHGSLCTALDYLGAFEFPEDITIGDWVVFHKTGAYGFTESMPFFLCHMLPGEVVSYNGDLMIPRPPKTSYDWMI
ncbi:MAG: PLP-dependent decarboxylase [Bacteriovoracaceae bacterium]|jgi:diaminopimelate decarboxylase|nr:diaminopimelate decarboxylase [Halobacteriovoraceae bacterium]MDP7320115.1 PLP-dependent decarboxylase [Bacteriovoracaceae bacterium]